MSMMGGRVPPGREAVGDTVATYPTYEAAQKAVSSLIAAEVPARDIAIVGQGLRSVERITGRLGYATAARSGAVNGLLLGLLMAFIFVLGQPNVSIAVFLGVLLIGVAIGMLLSLVMYAIVRRRRDFASVMQVVADRYEVCVLPTSLHRAREALGPVTTVAAPAREPRRTPADAPPPQYGERRPDPAAEPPRYGERVATAPAGENLSAPAADGPEVQDAPVAERRDEPA